MTQRGLRGPEEASVPILKLDPVPPVQGFHIILNSFCHFPPINTQQEMLKTTTEAITIESHNRQSDANSGLAEILRNKVILKVGNVTSIPTATVSVLGLGLWDFGLRENRGFGPQPPDTAVALSLGHLRTTEGPMCSSEQTRCHLWNLNQFLTLHQWSLGTDQPL